MSILAVTTKVDTGDIKISDALYRKRIQLIELRKIADKMIYGFL
jgi:hypothetical protein